MENKEINYTVQLKSIYSADAEKAILGTFISEPATIDEHSANLSSDDFYIPANQTIYRLILGLHAKNPNLDLVTLAQFATDASQIDKIGGVGYLAELITTHASALNLKHYVAVVKSKSTIRKIQAAALATLDSLLETTDSHDQLLDSAQARFSGINSEVLQDHEHDPNEYLEVLKEIEARNEINSKIVVGMPTGFQKLDRLVTIQKKQLITIGARPGVGKSALALNIRDAFLSHGYVAGFISLEMPFQEVALRSFAAAANIDSYSLERAYPRLTPDELQTLREVAKSFSQTTAPFCDAPSLSINQIRSIARKWKAKHKIDALFVDYLQFITATGQTRVDQVASISRGLKTLAAELDIVVFAVAQLNRGSEKDDREPRASDFKESGQIEQDSHKVLLLHTTDHDDNNPTAAYTLKVAKNRGGRTPKLAMTYHKSRLKFHEA